MKHAEVEFAAACLVRACQVHGDVWQPISQEQCEAVLKADYDAKRQPAYSWTTNPFFRPSMQMLVDEKYADFDGDGRIELTEKAFEALAKAR